MIWRLYTFSMHYASCSFFLALRVSRVSRETACHVLRDDKTPHDDTSQRCFAWSLSLGLSPKANIIRSASADRFKGTNYSHFCG